MLLSFMILRNGYGTRTITVQWTMGTVRVPVKLQTPKCQNEEEDFLYETSRKNNLESPWAIAITESGGSFLLVLGPNFSGLLTNSALLTATVGTGTVLYPY